MIIIQIQPSLLATGSLSQRSFFIITLNSSKSISPSPLASTSLMTSAQTSSEIFLPTPRTLLISSVEIDPLSSLSQNLNACFSLSSYNNEFLFTVAMMNSEKSISPLWSVSTRSKSLLASSSATSAPKCSVYPFRTSLYCNLPS